MDSKWNKEESDQLVMNENEMTIGGEEGGGGGGGGGSKILASNDEKNSLLSHPLIVDLVVMIFGISAWIGVNGIYIQLPLLVITAPEKWNLGAYLVVIVQAANVGPAIYTITRKCCNINESRCIFVLLITGSLSMGLLAFFYNTTFYIVGDREHSVILFICAFLVALLGCTSSVLFMPYLRNTNERYLILYFIGEGISGVLPSVVALLQGVGGGNSECISYANGTTLYSPPIPRFSSRHYFIFIFTVLLLSLCSFKLLQYILCIKRKDSVGSINSSSPRGVAPPTTIPIPVITTNVRRQFENPQNTVIYNINENIRKYRNIDSIGISRIIYMHILVGVVCFFGNGLLPGIQTYSCLPYGNIAFHLTVTLANIANPTASLIYLWINSMNFKVLDGLTVIGVIACTYATYLAFMSPEPPLRNSILGIILAVVAWILLTAIISYIKLFITSTIKEKLGPGALVGIGMVMQFGSACGAILSFALINYTSLFHQSKSCTSL